MTTNQTICSVQEEHWQKVLLRRKRWFTRDDMWGYLFITPMLIGLIIFQYIPIFGGFLISLTEFETLREMPDFVGLQNYETLLNDQFPWSFWETVQNTLFFVASVPLGISCGLALALLVNQKLPGINVFRTAYFLPMVTAIPAVALVWQAIYQPRFGLANYLLDMIGIAGPNWLGDPTWFKPSIVIFNIWKGAGWSMMIFLAGLQGVSSEYYEAARVDGANRFRRFFSITLPLISPQIFFVSVMLVIFSFNSFASVYVMGGGTRGGPLGSGATIVLYIYQKAFNSGDWGVGAAAAYVLALIILVITLFQFVLQKWWVFYDE